ncbi:hypothetical protein EZV62_005246 [Acer yangbiense]|uniref:Uncharacterized protein n=1 Tax=Acer yangbiense TaxID=1000413 RepID=A0A5C7IM57_9ROSI|nr:hypothetical protein EZV62_005246 [Acer yangbiense]
MRPINTSTSKRMGGPFLIEKGLPPMSNKTRYKDQAYTFGGSEYGESFVEETQVAAQGKIVGQGISLCIDLRSNESRDLGGIDMGGQKEVTAETITSSDRGAMGRIKDRREKRKIGKGIQSRVKSQPMKTSRTTGSKKRLKEVIWNLDEEITKTDFSISSIIWFLYQIIFNFLELAFSCRVYPPSKAEIEVLERQCGSIPMKFCHVEHGCVSFFFFNKVELPILP